MSGKERINIYADWNPWHGCTKISPGCKYCYVYRQDEMYGSTVSSSLCKKNQSFDLPVKRKETEHTKFLRARLFSLVLPLIFCWRTQTGGVTNVGK